MRFGAKLRRVLQVTIAWLSEREPMLLVSTLLVIAGTWAFVLIAGEVMEGDTHLFDEWAVKSFRNPNDLSQPIGPPWLQEMGRDATALGGVGWLVFFTLTVAGYLWLDRKAHMSQFLLAASISGMLLTFLLKYYFARPRPDVVPHLSHVSTSSFPSGHSMVSAVVYITLGSLLSAVVARRRLKAYILCVAMMLTLIVGVSRVYLGVHYPTDVLAGWTAGLSWALACWMLAHWLQRRGDVERE